jgi:hypothetical protein
MNKEEEMIIKDEKKLAIKFNRFIIARNKYDKTRFRTEKSRSEYKKKLDNMIINLKELSNMIQLKRENKILKDIDICLEKVNESKSIVKIEYDKYEIEY